MAGTPAGEGSDFLAHFDASGALLDATYLADSFVGSFALAADGSMLLAGDAISDVRFGGADWIAAPCMTSTLLSSATLNTTSAVPGEFVTLIGFGIGPEDGVSAQPGVNGTARTLGGVQVMFDGMAAPIIYAQSRQVNVQVPFEVSGQTLVTLNDNGAVFGPITVPVAASNADLFRLQPNVSAVAFAVNEDGTFNGPSNPAPAGSKVRLFGTGLGPLETPCATGGMNAPGPVNLAAGLSVKMLNGGPVTYAGGAPGLACGVFEIDMQVPADAQPGTLLLFPEMVSINSAGTPVAAYDQNGGSLLYVR